MAGRDKQTDWNLFLRPIWQLGWPAKTKPWRIISARYCNPLIRIGYPEGGEICHLGTVANIFFLARRLLSTLHSILPGQIRHTTIFFMLRWDIDSSIFIGNLGIQFHSSQTISESLSQPARHSISPSRNSPRCPPHCIII